MSKLSYGFLIASGVIFILMFTMTFHVGQVTIWTEIRKYLYISYVVIQVLIFLGGSILLMLKHRLELNRDAVKNFVISTIISGTYLFIIGSFLYMVKDGIH